MWKNGLVLKLKPISSVLNYLDYTRILQQIKSYCIILNPLLIINMFLIERRRLFQQSSTQSKKHLIGFYRNNMMGNKR